MVVSEFESALLDQKEVFAEMLVTIEFALIDIETGSRPDMIAKRKSALNLFNKTTSLLEELRNARLLALEYPPCAPDNPSADLST